jgi:transcriptional regulator with XRE-family HTH domain
MDFGDYVRTVGDNIRLHRENKGLTRKDLEDKTKITQQHIGRIERGETNPTLEVLFLLSDALKVPLSSFLGDYPTKLDTLIKKYKFTEKNDLYRLLIAFDKLDKAEIEMIIKMIAGLKK